MTRSRVRAAIGALIAAIALSGSAVRSWRHARGTVIFERPIHI